MQALVRVISRELKEQEVMFRTDENSQEMCKKNCVPGNNKDVEGQKGNQYS